MKQTIIPRLIWVSLLAATLPLVSAAADVPPPAPPAGEAHQPPPPDRFRWEITTMRARVGLVLNKLQALQKEEANLSVVFKEYTGEVTEMAKVAPEIAARANAMKQLDLTFFRAWEERTGTIQDPDLRKLAQNRYERRLKSYRKMITAMDEARQAFGPFLASVQDIGKLLESDLSRKSVQSAAKFFREVNLKGTDLENELYDVIIEESRVSAEFGRYQ